MRYMIVSRSNWTSHVEGSWLNGRPRHKVLQLALPGAWSSSEPLFLCPSLMVVGANHILCSNPHRAPSCAFTNNYCISLVHHSVLPFTCFLHCQPLGLLVATWLWGTVFSRQVSSIQQMHPGWWSFLFASASARASCPMFLPTCQPLKWFRWCASPVSATQQVIEKMHVTSSLALLFCSIDGGKNLFLFVI